MRITRLAEFKRDADAAIEEIIAPRNVPILVGGTGLYIVSVVDNLDIPEIKADPVCAPQIENKIETKRTRMLFLKNCVESTGGGIIVDPKNPRRVVRALEVATITGKPFTAQRRKNEPPYAILKLASTPAGGAARTHRSAHRRHDPRWLVDEVKNLIKKIWRERQHQSDKLPVAFDAIGYREIIDALEGRCSVDAAIAAMKMQHMALRETSNDLVQKR